MSWWRKMTPANERVLWTTLRPAECRDRLREKVAESSVFSRQPITKQYQYTVQAGDEGFTVRAHGPRSTDPTYSASGRFVPLAHGTSILVRLPTSRVLYTLNATIVAGLLVWIGLFLLVFLGGDLVTSNVVIFAVVAAVVFNVLLLIALVLAYARRQPTKIHDQPEIVRFLVETLEAEEESPAKPA